MSAEKRQEVWKKAEKLIASGKYAGVIEQLLEVDESGEFATTWRLAAEVRWKESEKSNQEELERLLRTTEKP